MGFRLASDYSPRGDQSTAIDQLVAGARNGDCHQVLLGVTGSGKTYTVAKVIEALQRPTLVLAHNKTLGAQLYHEFQSFFPENAVEYFVSYYDYYQPEAYVPASDTYIEKESTINDRSEQTAPRGDAGPFRAPRRASSWPASPASTVSARPMPTTMMLLMLEQGQRISRKEITRQLVKILYSRKDLGDFERGSVPRASATSSRSSPPYDDLAYRMELWGDEIESHLLQFDPLLGEVKQTYHRLPIYPASSQLPCDVTTKPMLRAHRQHH